MSKARDRRLTWRLARDEYERFASVLDGLGPEGWAAPTDCTEWTVRDVALHVLGSVEANASPLENAHQLRRGLARGSRVGAVHWVDGINRVQVADRARLASTAIAGRIRAAAPSAVRIRHHLPAPLRWAPVPIGPPIGWKPLSYLLADGFTRDTWMHRVDVCRATGRPLQLTAAHDGLLVAGIVAEWAALHRRPFRLDLGGPAGGRFERGERGPRLEYDAVEFCRILSGRGPAGGVLGMPLPL